MGIQPIVEGHGDVEAAPILLRRLMDAAGVVGLQVHRPIRQKQFQLLQEESFRKAVGLARKQRDCRAILVLFESEDDCPKELGPRLVQWARSEARGVPCAVALANREYESWFLGAMESLRGKRGVRPDAQSPPDPERRRGAKEELERQMAPGRAYAETTDQPALTAQFDMKSAYRTCRSFRHLVKAFGELMRAAGQTMDVWPPQDWLESATEEQGTR